ncbi:MAG: radical SAM protein [Rhodospirillaceae bacterium]|nr:radical SAM protein [Rhodospirillaceae bacterium]
MNEMTIGLGPRIDPSKFRDPERTASGDRRAEVALRQLETLWFNTGTLCNLACGNCYIESSPTNDRLVYLTLAEVESFLDEIAELGLNTQEIAFTGGETFMNPEFIPMLESVLARGFEALILTNAMRPMMKRAEDLLELAPRDRLMLRVSLDHFTEEGHQLIRGPRSWDPAIMGLKWLSDNGFSISVASRTCWQEDETKIRRGFTNLFAVENINIDAEDPSRLVLFPEMDEKLDVPEITTQCWDILGISPDEMMCASSRMILKRKGDLSPVISPCTLLPYDEAFDLGTTLAGAIPSVKLNHPHCAKFCVLGGASCSASNSP